LYSIASPVSLSSMYLFFTVTTCKSIDRDRRTTSSRLRCHALHVPGFPSLRSTATIFFSPFPASLECDLRTRGNEIAFPPLRYLQVP
jgi:hypothetical protein